MMCAIIDSVRLILLCHNHDKVHAGMYQNIIDQLSVADTHVVQLRAGNTLLKSLVNSQPRRLLESSANRKCSS